MNDQKNKHEPWSWFLYTEFFEPRHMCVFKRVCFRMSPPFPLSFVVLQSLRQIHWLICFWTHLIVSLSHFFFYCALSWLLTKAGKTFFLDLSSSASLSYFVFHNIPFSSCSKQDNFTSFVHCRAQVSFHIFYDCYVKWLEDKSPPGKEV